MTAPKVAELPLADLTPAPWNPRTIKDERFKNLCASIEADPEFLWRRPILAMADGTIYAGNMRFRAAAHLRLESVPAIVEDVPEALAKERALKDNAQWGEWNEEQLAALMQELAGSGSDMELVGFEDKELARLLGLAPLAEYTQEIVSPIYEPKGEQPPVDSLYDAMRAGALLAEIDAAGLVEPLAAFLRLAAYRHVAIRFDRVADYYAHAPAEVQALFEASALVIVDADQAVERGFLKLHRDVLEAFDEDYPDAR